MQNSFYTSGFLYSLKTHQILLLELSQGSLPSSWSTIGADGIEDEAAHVTFQRLINKLLNIKLSTENIHPVYDYFQNTRNKFNFVFYGEIKNIEAFNKLKKANFSWFSFQEIVKLSLNSQTKQDIVVGERVINAKRREDYAKSIS